MQLLPVLLICSAAILFLCGYASEMQSQTKEWAWEGGGSVADQPGVYGALGAEGATYVPGGRAAAAAWTDKNGNLWLFGGNGNDSQGNSGYLNDLWELDPATMRWTWMGGSSTIMNGAGPSGSYGVSNTPAPANVPGGRFRAASWSDSDGNLWLFGGTGYDSAGNFGYLNDLWSFSPKTDEWTWVGGSSQLTCGATPPCGQAGSYGTEGAFAAGNVPGGREAATVWVGTDGEVWLFGGFGSDAAGTQGYLNDLWEFDPSKGEWAWMGGSSTVPAAYFGQPGIYGTEGSPSTTNIPGGRELSSGWVDANGMFWLFGGFFADASAEGWINDLWVFDSKAGTWTWAGGSSSANQPGSYLQLGVAGGGNAPGARAGAGSWVDGNGALWLFGGDGYDSAGHNGELNDLWQLDSATTEWTWSKGGSTINAAGDYGVLGAAQPTTAPGARDGAAAWTDSSGNEWIFGGEGVDAQGTYGLLNDLWLEGNVTAAPSFSLPAGSYSGAQSVTISDATTGAAIYYTLDGTTPTTSSNLYGGSVTINISTETLQAIAVAPGFLASNVSSALYELSGLPAAQGLTFNPPGGTYLSGQMVSITDTTPGATIYYTTGAAPSASSTLYSGPITVSSTTTLRALVVAPGYADQAGSATYTVNTPQTAAPEFYPSTGIYNSMQKVAITSATPGATIYYAIDATPTTASTIYRGPITVSASETLEAIAVGPGLPASTESSATYSIHVLAPRLTVTGRNPYAMTCSVAGSGSVGVPVPTGNLSFIDATTGQVLGVAPVGSASAQTVYRQTTSLVGNGPTAMVTADFNGDGKPDLAVANTLDKTISILLGNGDGTFQPQSIIHLASYPENVVVGDFNHDGYPDLAVSSLESQSITILLGNGDGTFTAMANGPSIAAAPEVVLAGDFNQDGIPDLVVNGNDGTVSVFLGNGDGTFQPAITTETSFAITATVAGDFNGDGKLDLVATSGGSTPLTLLAGNGDGTFQIQPIAASSELTGNPLLVAAGDFNGDGTLDLAVFEYFISNALAVLPGDGKGGFQYSSALVQPINVGFYPTGVAVAAFNGNKALDLAVSDAYGNDVLLFTGMGNGTFLQPALYPVGGSPGAIVAADLNGDGIVDFAAPELNTNTVGVALSGVKVSGSASLSNVTVSPEAFVSHNLVCTYSGDANYGPAGSNIVVERYTQTAKPSILPLRSPLPGTQVIALTDLTPRASIYYTTNGTNPTTSSPLYTNPIHIDSPTTVRAMAIATGEAKSATAQANFAAAATPEFTYIASTGSGATKTGREAGAAQADGASQLVTMTDKTPGAVIYYTTDGTSPSTSSKRYIGPLTLPVSATIKAFAAAPGSINSHTTIAPEIVWQPPAPITYGEALTRRQLDAWSPIKGTLAYKFGVGTILGSGDQRLKLTFTPLEPANYASATKIVPILVNRALLTVTADDQDVLYGKPIPRMRYTIKGFVNGDGLGTLRGAPAITTKAKDGAPPGRYRIALAVGTLSAENYSFQFHDGLLVILPLGRVAEPVFTLAGGTYDSAQTVSITDADKGATIYYAVHGVTPTTLSTKYTGPIHVDSTETIKAIAVKAGYSDSSVATIKYTISPSPAVGFVPGCDKAAVGLAPSCAPALPVNSK